MRGATGNRSTTEKTGMEALPDWLRPPASSPASAPTQGMPPARPSAINVIRELALPAPTLLSSDNCKTAYVLLAQEDSFPGLAVLSPEGRIVGLVCRITLLSLFSQPLLHALYEKRPITLVMDADPLIADAETTLDALSKRIATEKPNALMGGFVVTGGGPARNYLGIGSTQDLMRASTALAELRAVELERTSNAAEEALAELRETQHQLVEAKKLSALGKIVAGIGHEINTPIGVAISAATTLIAKTNDLLEEISTGTIRRKSIETFAGVSRQSVDLLERNLNRAAELIQNFKQLAVDQTTYPRRAFDLGEEVETVLTMLSSTFKNGPIQVEVEIPAGIVIDGYPGPLQQIVGNTLNNALTHAFTGRRQGGRVKFTARPAAGDKVALICWDDGSGMSAEVLRRAFEPFFTTRLGQGGSGLGLHIVYTLVTGVMGGEIILESLPGKGTALTVTLPLTAPADAGTELL